MRVGADFLERLEETVAFAGTAAADSGCAARMQRHGVEEAVAEFALDLVAGRVFELLLGGVERRQLGDGHVFGVKHERADGDDIVQALVGGHHHGVAVLVERRDGDVPHQTELGAERGHLAVVHYRQLQAVAAAAAVIDHLDLGAAERRHDHVGQRRHRHVFGQRMQHHADVADRVLVHFAAVAMAVQLHLEDVLGGQEGIDVFGRERHFALADTVEQGLQDVRHFRHVGHAERGGAALDRVGGAEDGVEILGVGGIDIDGQQQPFHLCQQFLGLIEKDLEKLAYIDGHGDTP